MSREQQAKNQAVERLLALITDLDLGEEALDETVHECHAAAAGVNNGGWRSQVEYLLGHKPEAEVERLIREAARPDEPEEQPE